MSETHPHYEVIDTRVKMKWNQANKDFYEKLGYIFTFYGDEFDIYVHELKDSSQRKVLVKCPLCPSPRYVSYVSAKRAGHTYCRKHSRLQDLTGFKSGRLTARRYTGVDTKNNPLWECVCECGNSCAVKASEILRHGIKSCGCLLDEYRSDFPTGEDNKLWNHVNLVCPVCGKLFSIKESQKNKYRKNYCSIKCKAQWQHENLTGENNPGWSRVEIQCDNCKKKFKRVKYWAENDTTHRFCSANCRHQYSSRYIRGKNHHQWTSEEVECNYCGKRFFKKKHSITEKNFCSREHFFLYNVGENHSSYNPNMSDEEREAGRTYPEYRNWVSSVYSKFLYKCVVCGSNQDIVAHHLDSYAEYPQRRLDINNGVVLCNKHHMEFHHGFMGGTYKPCTTADFDEWMDTIGDSFDINANIN